MILYGSLYFQIDLAALTLLLAFKCDGLLFLIPLVPVTNLVSLVQGYFNVILFGLIRPGFGFALFFRTGCGCFWVRDPVPAVDL